MFLKLWRETIITSYQVKDISSNYNRVIQSVLGSSVIVRFGSASKQDKNRRQQTIRTREQITSANLHPSIQDLHTPQTGENEQAASLRIPHIPDTISFSFSPQGGATHPWTLHQLDMRTVPSHRLPLCSTLYQSVSRSTHAYKHKKCSRTLPPTIYHHGKYHKNIHT